jgi:hypothetical protein
LNFKAGDIVPNSVQVALPTAGANAGQIDITYDAFGVAGPTTEVLIDVVGYMVLGAAGPTGPAGAPGANGVTSIVARTAGVNAGTGVGYKSVSCAAGEVATGGGFTWDTSAYSGLHIASLGPLAGDVPTGWSVGYDNLSGSAKAGTLTVLCAATAG